MLEGVSLDDLSVSGYQARDRRRLDAVMAQTAGAPSPCTDDPLGARSVPLPLLKPFTFAARWTSCCLSQISCTTNAGPANKEELPEHSNQQAY